MINILTKIKSTIGKLKGYGECKHCKLSWIVVDSFNIPYEVKLPERGGSGMFPISIECFKKLSPEEIFIYCKQLAETWYKTPSYRNIDFDVVKHNIKFLKNQLFIKY